MSACLLESVVRVVAPDLDAQVSWLIDECGWSSLDVAEHYGDLLQRRLFALSARACAGRSTEMAPSSTVAPSRVATIKPTRGAVDRAPYRPRVKPTEIDRAAARAALLRLGLMPTRRTS